jgi:predicted ribosomally synthesized peptide with nif11-like leader
MSEEQLNAFLEKVKADTSLQEKLKTAASPGAAIGIAKAAGFSITSDDIQSMQSATVELSDEELEAAAGGRWRIGTIVPGWSQNQCQGC